MTKHSVKKVKKRDGRIADFDKKKIANAIFRAAESVGGHDKEVSEKPIFPWKDNQMQTEPLSQRPFTDETA